jgi:cytochrome c oxidase subunit 2
MLGNIDGRHYDIEGEYIVMQKWIMFALVSIASVMAVCLVAFGLPDKPVDESASLPEGTFIMNIIASNDFTFNQEEFTAKVGETAIMKFSNKSGVHGIDIENLGISLDRDDAQTEYTFTEPGEYEIICNIPCGPGHAVMVAKLIVTAA